MGEDRDPVRDAFNTVAPGYDNEPLRFFRLSAAHLPEVLNLRGNERVLDVATGTGNAALALSSALPAGQVMGVDFSEGMLSIAREKARQAAVSNVSFQCMDMRTLSAMRESDFDVAVSAFGVFFAEDMVAQVKEIMQKVRPGGRMLMTSFHESTFEPIKSMFISRIETYGAEVPQTSMRRLVTEDSCRELFAEAGLRDVSIAQRDVGYWLRDESEWWEIVFNAGYRRFVGQLSPADAQRFKDEHLAEVRGLMREQGIRLDVQVLYTVGTKSGQ